MSTAVGDVIRDYLNHLTVEKGVSPHTYAAYRRDLDRYAHFLDGQGRTDVHEVTERDVTDFRRALSEASPATATGPARPALAHSSVARVLAAVRGLHRFAMREGLVAVDVAAHVASPRSGERLPKALTVADTIALLHAAGESDHDNDPARLRDRAMVELLYSSGLRATELINLNVDDVATLPPAGEFAAMSVRGKGNKQRLVPVGSCARAALDAYLVRARPALNTAGIPALFLNLRGKRISRVSLWQVVRTAGERAGVSQEVSPHTLRHSFATHLLDGGADIRVVQEMLGHASVTTTQIYTKVTIDTLREVWAETHPRAR